MTLLEILLTIFAAIFVGILFYYIFKSTGPWGSFWTFIVILILAGIAAEAWIEPFGPVYYGVAWVPTLFVILLFALVLAAATPPSREPRPERAATTRSEPTPSETAGAVIGGFFWILLIFLFFAALWGIFV